MPEKLVSRRITAVQNVNIGIEMEIVESQRFARVNIMWINFVHTFMVWSCKFSAWLWYIDKP